MTSHATTIESDYLNNSNWTYGQGAIFDTSVEWSPVSGLEYGDQIRAEVVMYNNPSNGHEITPWYLAGFDPTYMW
ncbi:hypothetical protein [Tenuibacillus multivorans]|nr:hypothetical protein [Tenuibacillus multivorans]